MLIFIKRTLDLAPMDHVFLSQIWLAVGHFYYYRWTHAHTNQYYLSWTELRAKSILISRKFKSPGDGMVYIIQNNIAIQTGAFWETVKSIQAMDEAKPIERVKLQRELHNRSYPALLCLWAPRRVE